MLTLEIGNSRIFLLVREYQQRPQWNGKLICRWKLWKEMVAYF
jgi:hypothetical protein